MAIIIIVPFSASLRTPLASSHLLHFSASPSSLDQPASHRVFGVTAAAAPQSSRNSSKGKGNKKHGISYEAPTSPRRLRVRDACPSAELGRGFGGPDLAFDGDGHWERKRASCCLPAWDIFLQLRVHEIPRQWQISCVARKTKSLGKLSGTGNPVESMA
ncbi:uncharacterized protein LOC130134575 isoform X4 [Syzygium oleosum]|uniref:uncharacterized protein LOC130134575 isoform X4 n=1 Tax=Syzygium oleosum TaxID=219896 RepID=UPI0024BA4680|nr:uncharacterized protein LOC130134575 isoform X4 [Syzygium oleosum]